MIIVKLSEIFGRKKLKIADVIRNTGITRPTLTSLYYGKGNAISFDTLNKLCRYLKVSTDEILKFYDFDIESINVKYSRCDKNKQNESIGIWYQCEIKFAQSHIDTISVTSHVTPADFRLININHELRLTESAYVNLFPLDVREVIIHELTSSVYTRFVSQNDDKTDIGNVTTSFIAN